LVRYVLFAEARVGEHDRKEGVHAGIGCRQDFLALEIGDLRDAGVRPDKHGFGA